MKKDPRNKPEPKTYPVELINVSSIERLFDDETLKNPNHMTAQHLKLLTSAMEEVGFLQPILVTETATGFKVIDGHHRLEAAMQAGAAQIQAVVIPEGAITNATALGHALGLNRLRGDLDVTLAADLMQLMREEAGYTDGQISLLSGFTTKEVEALLASGNDSAVMDDVAEAPDVEEQEPRAVKPFVLEIEFADKALFQKVKRALKKAAGPSKDFAEGIVNALGLGE